MNPVLKDEVFRREQSFAVGETMSMQGTIHKSISAVALCFLSALLTWQYAAQSPAIQGIITLSLIGGLILYFITLFKKSWSPVTVPLYSIAEGAVLGGVSLAFEARFPGIVFNTVLLTFGVLFTMLTVYRLGWIKVTNKLRIGIISAGGAIALIYIVDMIMHFFGHGVPYIHQSTNIGIGFSLVVVAIASMFLLLDFDFIERAVQARSPKYMEWFGAFGLLVTLVWLYLEILTLLAKLQSRR